MSTVYNIIFFIQRWLGSIGEVALIFTGILISVLALSYFWDQKIGKILFVVGFVSGLTLYCTIFFEAVVQSPSDHHFLVALLGGSLATVLAWIIVSADLRNRVQPGTKLAAPAVILLAVLAVLTVGLLTPQVMIGDEVTHFYMLQRQADDLSTLNFFAHIPTGSGETDIRRYPHSFAWHYIGAVVYALSGKSFLAVQFYQLLFFLQLLVVVYLLSLSRGGVKSNSALIYLLSLASLPLCLMFSVTFYQDVPMTAQVVTSFFLLTRKRWLVSAGFMALAIAIKVTAILFFPAYFVLLLYWLVRSVSLRRAAFNFFVSVLIVMGTTWSLGKAINIYAESSFYPQEKLEVIWDTAKIAVSRLVSSEDSTPVAPDQEISQVVEMAEDKPRKSSENMPVIIANHPGDLRVKGNWLVYGGIVLWLVIIGSLILRMPFLVRSGKQEGRVEGDSLSIWLWFTGGSFLLLTAYFAKTAPDARFFLPGLPFVLLPLSEKLARGPKNRFIIIILTTLSILQASYVLSKVYKLRTITPGTQAAIEYLAENPPYPPKVFMYPEGNYRYFPVNHEWYLRYKLRDFWRADNDERIRMLRAHRIGALVIKKYLVSPVDKKITNLGVYPDYFVKDIENDARFKVVLNNSEIKIYTLVNNQRNSQ